MAEVRRRPVVWGSMLLAGCVVLVAPTQGQEPAPLQRIPPRGEKYALLVGVRNYNKNELRNLPYTERDVVELARVLRAEGYRPENVVLLTQTRGAEESRFLPQASVIRRELKLLLRNRARGDSVLVALAGHGVQFKGSDDSYFCPMDARLADKNSLLSLAEVYKELEKCKAGFRLLLVDACRNEPLADQSRSRPEVEVESATRPKLRSPPGGVAALFSCSAGEKAFEHPQLEHGVFFHFVIKGLQGEGDLDKDRNVTLPELEQFVKQRVPDFVRAEYGEPQTPDLVGQTRGLVPLVCLDRPKRGSLGVVGLRAVKLDQAKRVQQVPGERAAMFMISGVLPGSSGEKAGVRPGDLIIRVNEQDMTDLKQCDAAIAEAGPGATITLDLIRHGERRQVKAVLEEMPTQNEVAGRLRKAAEQGEAWAQSQLGYLYLRGKGVARDAKEAARWFRQTAEQGDAVAQGELALMYLGGQGMAQDIGEAVRWLRQAADHGNSGGQVGLAMIYERGWPGVIKPDAVQAAKWYRKAAEQESDTAQTNLGLMYEEGRGVDQSDAEAVRWYRAAAEQGYADAQLRLGVLYYAGRGVPKNAAEAFRWLFQAAEQGHRQAQHKVGILYARGEGVVQSYGEAAEWFRESAEQGFHPAQLTLGLAYLEGYGVPKDEAEAIRWFRKAAEQGNADAQQALQKRGLK